MSIPFQEIYCARSASIHVPYKSRKAIPLLVRSEFLSWGYDNFGMKATITSKGQITIPIAIREKLDLKPGDQIEFDESATILVGRRVVDNSEWQATLNAWREDAREVLSGHPWDKATALEVVDDLRS